MPIDKIAELSEEWKKINVDNLPYDVTDVHYPIPLEEGKSVPEFSLDSIATRVRTRESRQITSRTCRYMFKLYQYLLCNGHELEWMHEGVLSINRDVQV